MAASTDATRTFCVQNYARNPTTTRPTAYLRPAEEMRDLIRAAIKTGRPGHFSGVQPEVFDDFAGEVTLKVARSTKLAGTSQGLIFLHLDVGLIGLWTACRREELTDRQRELLAAKEG